MDTCKNFLTLALMVWELQYFEDFEEKGQTWQNLAEIGLTYINLA